MKARLEFWRYSSRNREGHVSHPLTLARRNLILELWAAGKTKDQIAEELDVDLDTISRHFREARQAGDARAVIRHPATLNEKRHGMKLQALPIDRVRPRTDGRPVNEAAVRGLVDSIGAVGLINPIRVRALGDGWEIIAGVHRWEAHRRMGKAEISCLLVDADELHAELAMIDENLCRAELTPSDRAKHTARRKEIYEELHPETRHGGDRKSQTVRLENEGRFTADTAAATGVSERLVQLNAERGEKVVPEALDLISGTKLDTGTYLDKLKRLDPSEQADAVTRDLAAVEQQERDKASGLGRSKIDADVKARAAKEVANIMAEYVPGEWWGGLKANLFAAGAVNIANELTNITGQSVMTDMGVA